MKKTTRVWSVFLVISILAIPSVIWSWGYFAHKWIHREAIKLLPLPLQSFYQSAADSIIEKAIEPDLRRRRVQNEEFHHYIDIDHYGRYPFTEMPRDYAAAVKKFSADTLLSYGDAPWQIARVLDSLTAAMRSGKTKSVIQFSADLGHYVADLHMPLHTSENYDGKTSGNRGIHSRFEWQMIERFQKQIHLNPSGIDSIANAAEAAFEIVLNSHIWADNILRADTRSRVPLKVYETSDSFDQTYYDKLFALVGPVAEQQMTAATKAVASFWYTAWLRAGRPQL